MYVHTNILIIVYNDTILINNRCRVKSKSGFFVFVRSAQQMRKPGRILTFFSSIQCLPDPVRRKSLPHQKRLHPPLFGRIRRFRIKMLLLQKPADHPLLILPAVPLLHIDKRLFDQAAVHAFLPELIRDPPDAFLFDLIFHIASGIGRVIHIADTDGLFIPDTAVRLDYKAKHAEYEEDAIYTCNPDSIKQRNRRRRGNVKALIHTRSLQGNIPYSIFYLSRNIEHALYGIESHVNDSRKTDLAYDFSDHFGYDWKLFMNYIENEGITIGNTYKESWELIQNDTESLKRHTNIIYLFDEDV